MAGFIGTPSMNFLDVVIKKEGDALYLDGESFKIKIPAEIQSALLPYVNKEVTLGIRPQDIYDCNFSQEMAEVDGNVIETTVDIVEPLGSEQTVYLVTASRSCCIRYAYSYQCGRYFENTGGHL